MVNRAAYPRVRAARPQVAFHPPSDRCVVRRGVRGQQRHRRERLAGLAVAALHDVSAIPSIPNRVDDRPGDALNGGDGLADGTTGRRLAGLLVLAVDQDGARGTEAGATAELRSVKPEYVTQNPQKRRRFVAVVDVDARAVHGQSHANEYQGTGGGLNPGKLPGIGPRSPFVG